jgi:DNA-directed RNA polymerase subunit RPC12/RpoP
MDKAERHEVGQCPKCGTTIWSDHPYAWCSRCGEGLPEELKARLTTQQPPAKAAAPAQEEGDALTVAGHAVACPICHHERFHMRRTLMESRGGALFGVDWASPAAETYICVRCGHVLWFMR